MKDAAYKSFSKKGDKIVQMNYEAIDAGVNAVVKVSVPAAWANAGDDEDRVAPANTKSDMLNHFVNKILRPVNEQKGDSLPVSAFKGVEDGTYPLGLSAFEKRGVAIEVPEWIPGNCIQCNQCSFVCPHATIRPFVLSEDEMKDAPEGFKAVKMNGKGAEDKKFAVCVSPMDCMGCGLCASVCPAKNKALVMKPIETQLDRQADFDYAEAKVSDKELPFALASVKGSQFKKPLLEFSGACAGCVEPIYARLITQLFGDRMYVANATGCSSIWGGSAPSMPYHGHKKGFGPSWANSLFEGQRRVRTWHGYCRQGAPRTF